VLGVLGFGEDGKIVEKQLFPKDSVKIAEKLTEIESGKAVDEIISLVKKMKAEGYDAFVFENSAIADAVKENLGVEAFSEIPSGIGETFRGNIGEFAVEAEFIKESSEITRWVHDVSMELSRIRVRKAIEKRDQLVVQAIQAADDLERTLNLFMSRIREWNGLHFPELDRLIDKHETYARLLLNLGNRKNFTAESLEKEGLAKNKALQVSQAAKASMGADLNDTDIAQVQTLCEDALQMYEARSRLEKYIDDVMEQVAPNTRALIGAALGAKLISLAGGLSNLAKMPASTVQVLGAEKALFRSLTTGAKPPKHGIIYQHALIHGAKGWQRGKISRALAGKLTIAIRSDAFGGNYIGDRLKEQLQERIEEIEKKYPQPKPKPKVQEKKPKKPKRWKRYGRKG